MPLIFRDALQLFRRMGNRDGEAATLNSVGYVYEDVGEREKAIVYYEEAFRLIKPLESFGHKLTRFTTWGGCTMR